MAVNIHTEAVYDCAKRIRSIHQRLEESYAQVDQAVSGLTGNWSGTAAEEAATVLRGIKGRHALGHYAAVEQLTAFLEERVVQRYDETEKRRAAAAAEFR